MMNRRKAREYAFILLFEYRFQPDEIERILEDFLSEHDAGPQADYIRTVVEGAVEHVEEIDGLIGSYARDWDVQRISVVCMAVMRLAVYEMKYMPDIPPNVSVNEAVALAKEYDGEKAAPFVNGILDNMKEICK